MKTKATPSVAKDLRKAVRKQMKEAPQIVPNHELQIAAVQIPQRVPPAHANNRTTEVQDPAVRVMKEEEAAAAPMKAAPMKMITGVHHQGEVIAVQLAGDHFRKEIITVNGMTANMIEVIGKKILRVEETWGNLMTNIIPDGAGVMKEITDTREDQDMAKTGIQAGIKTDIMMTGMSAEDQTMAAHQIEIRTGKTMKVIGPPGMTG